MPFFVVKLHSRQTKTQMMIFSGPMSITFQLDCQECTKEKVTVSDVILLNGNCTWLPSMELRSFGLFITKPAILEIMFYLYVVIINFFLKEVADLICWLFMWKPHDGYMWNTKEIRVNSLLLWKSHEMGRAIWKLPILLFWFVFVGKTFEC